MDEIDSYYKTPSELSHAVTGMRLPESQIRTALLHEDEEIRYKAASWYSKGFSRDPSVMGTVLESVERFGPAQSWRVMREAQWLPQTAETVDALIAQLNRAGDPADLREENFRFATGLALCRAPVELIADRATQIDQMPSIPLVLWKPLIERVQLRSADWDEAIAALVRLAEKTYRSRQWNRIDSLRADGVIDLLTRFTGSRGPAVLALLERRKNQKLVEWLEPVIIRLAGMMQLTAAIPLMLDRLESAETTRSVDMGMALVIALARMGSDAVLAPLGGRWALSNRLGEQGAMRLRLFACNVLERLRSDQSVALLKDRIKDKVELASVRFFAAHALLAQFALNATTVIRVLIRHAKSEGYRRRLRLYYDLLAACRVMNETFPKFETRYQKALAANWGRANEVPRLADEYYEGPWRSERGAG